MKISFDENGTKGGARWVRYALLLLPLAIFGVLILVRQSGGLPSGNDGYWECREGEWVAIDRPETAVPSRPCPKTAELEPGERAESGAQSELSEETQEEGTFFQKGNLLRGLPNLKPGALYLSYDPRGVRTEIAALSFDDRSQCLIAQQAVPCTDSRIDGGLWVQVSGIFRSGTVTVQELEALQADIE